ncbi:MAG: tRNA pseudouridine(55) synthase TruB [Cytophagales bacterium]|nr:tRNA pseudouridine(55) synthase TruB [Cytophagales bacterium]
MEQRQIFEDGVMLLVNKPKDWTSFDVVNKLRYSTKVKKIGHAGTLDPMATGLLIICTGKKTKEIDAYQAQEKEYTGTFTFGHTTPSYDSETQYNGTYDYSHIDNEMLVQNTEAFKGNIMQFPPAYSAVKVQGKKLYELARKGKSVEVQPRQVVVSTFDITNIRMPEVDFKIVCSKGTYIRSIANDYGKYCKSGAYLSALCRTRIGEYKLSKAYELTNLVEQINKGNFAANH